MNLSTIRPQVDTILSFLIKNTPTERLPQVDAIFVFGHYRPEIILHAIDLWKQELSNYIIISGKGRDKIPKGWQTEADFYNSIAQRNEIPNKNLILEKKATNTLENVRLGIKAALKDGLTPKSLILCAMPPLLRRSCATFKQQFPKISVYGSAFPIPEAWFSIYRIQRLLGELERLEKYAKKGDIAKVNIPDKVHAAKQSIEKFLSSSTVS